MSFDPSRLLFQATAWLRLERGLKAVRPTIRAAAPSSNHSLICGAKLGSIVF